MSRRPATDRKRGTYIGGPDAAAIVGANRYATSADVYARLVHGHVAERNPRMLRGLIVEPGLIDYAAEWRGVEIARDCFWLDDKVPFFGCSIDGSEPDIDRPKVIHETKSYRPSTHGMEHDEKWGPTDSDDVEPSAAAQCQWEMGISGAREAHVWMFRLDEDALPYHYLVQRDERRIREMRQACEAFWWDHVVLKIPPPVAPYDEDAARAMYPSGTDKKRIEPTAEIYDAAMKHAAARAMRDMGIAGMKVAGAILRNAMGNAEKCSWEADPQVGRWKASISLKAAQVPEPVTDWETIAHQLAERFKIPGHIFHGLTKENTRRPYTARQLRVTVTAPKNKG